MRFDLTWGSCGTVECHELERQNTGPTRGEKLYDSFSFEKFIDAFIEYSKKRKNFAFVWLSHNTINMAMLDAVEQGVVSNGLGKVYRTDAHRNPNSGYDIINLTWAVNWAALEAYAKYRSDERKAVKYFYHTLMTSQDYPLIKSANYG